MPEDRYYMTASLQDALVAAYRSAYWTAGGALAPLTPDVVALLVAAHAFTVAAATALGRARAELEREHGLTT
jgi:hypothetical protein